MRGGVSFASMGRFNLFAGSIFTNSNFERLDF